MRIEYVNTKGQRVTMQPGERNRAIGTDVRGYAWKAEMKGNRINRITRDPKEFTLTVRTSGDKAERDRVYEVFDYDLAMGKPGRLYVGDSYCECFARASSSAKWNNAAGYMQRSITFTPKTGEWLREVPSGQFGGDPYDLGALDYAYDYAHDYAFRSMNVETVEHKLFGRPGVVMTFHAGSGHPLAFIDGNRYEITQEVTDGYIELDTRNKTTIWYRGNGNVETVFPKVSGTFKKGSGSYIFENAPEDGFTLSWDSSLIFDLKLVEVRSEPAWN